MNDGRLHGAVVDELLDAFVQRRRDTNVKSGEEASQVGSRVQARDFKVRRIR